MSVFISDVLANPDRYLGKQLDLKGLLLGPTFRLCDNAGVGIKIQFDTSLEKDLISKLPNFVGGRALINSQCEISCSITKEDGELLLGEITKIVVPSPSGNSLLIRPGEQ